MNVIALVPMKDHSERVPNKNMRDFHGLPLYHRIINTLSASKYVSKIYVDTDSELIKHDILHHFNQVKIISRPGKLCGDFVSMNKIIEYDISQIDGKHFLQTHSTNPLLTTKTVDEAIETYFKELDEYDSLFGVTRYQSRFYDNDGVTINHDPDVLERTQDLSPLFEDNCNLYIFSRESFQYNCNRIGDYPYAFEINKMEAIDIDDEIDFKMAEMVWKNLKLC